MKLDVYKWPFDGFTAGLLWQMGIADSCRFNQTLIIGENSISAAKWCIFNEDYYVNKWVAAVDQWCLDASISRCRLKLKFIGDRHRLW